MNTLYIVLVFGVLLYSLYNAIIYNKRRLQDKKTTKEALDAMVYHRELTEEEQRLLDGLQKRKGLKKTHRRIDDKVYLIKGGYRRHGIETRYNTTWHNLIGGLEVTMDDRALDYIRDINIAEVVKTDKFPLVIGLNHDFSLLGHIAAEKQLESGALGKMPGSGAELIHNRKQTVHEIQAVEKLWQGTLGAFIMVAALFFLALTSIWGVDVQWGAIPGGILFLIALYFVWRKPKYTKPKDVRVLKGIPSFTAILDAAQNIKGVKAFIGKTELKYEGLWLPFMASGDDNTAVDVDVTIDGRLMRFGPHLSLGDEEKQFPSKAWYRHGIIAIIAIIAAIGVWTLVLRSRYYVLIEWEQGLPFIEDVFLSVPGIFFVLNLFLIAIHGPLAIIGYNYTKKRKKNIHRYYSQLIEVQ
ncbi:IgaA/UmoB family intracellular growth attenuator [Pseudozobellia thermophila]|uniref:Intracellular growth attenuator protein IgaA n=1 Tax=Pseudozobellia thermophila TaxID=192903 RepID=A0A1M6ELY0_9FLAO|nr:IgaA/UmoB family intracellular growth attenuator [Pseudozobellia thermophila]SHI86483.1 Intracellular growth attenuator protein IgaA [Pseudozobellia thermophila]